LTCKTRAHSKQKENLGAHEEKKKIKTKTFALGKKKRKEKKKKTPKKKGGGKKKKKKKKKPLASYS